ncbi:MAG: winged helix-turn-helix domain-containing protein [Candidatus Peregrinibacteria bacterium]|nr:winged helix-turn-helix domain-containing protein [Candidatus Peregrinibacteria bacterium]
MESLPSSIETYLLEAGFSGTELVILKKLMEGEAMTLREIAAKTGKSTGVLDQAMKKLLQKKIVTKEWINDTNKYALRSITAIAEWINQDITQKHALIVRKQQNFESFIATLKRDQTRPEMEYFEGEEGMKKAYMQLLEMGEEMLHYFPVKTTAEEDPLRDFRVDFFRDRRRRGIFARYIVHNTPLGRRFQSRDPFEYRKTVLVSSEEYPFTFEQVIVGNTFACFNHEEKKVCFVHFAELAQTERIFFKAIWKLHTERNPQMEEAPIVRDFEPEKPVVPLQTRTLSGVREFFLSRKSIATFSGLFLLAAIITYGLYLNNKRIITQRIRDQITSIAATGALQFSATDLDTLRSVNDVTRIEYKKVVDQLNAIRNQNKNIVYVYLIRPTTDPAFFEFVADADAVDPYKDVDTNKDGKIDDADTLGLPGMKYDIAGMDVLEAGEYDVPTANHKPYTDKWGSFVTGYAPVVDDKGNISALLSVDVWADEIQRVNDNTFVPLLYFIGFFTLFVFIRFAAFNKSLAKELIYILQLRKFVIVLSFCVMFSLLVTYGIYLKTLELMKNEIGERLMSIAATAAPTIDGEQLENIRLPRDMRSAAYQKIFDKLNEIRDHNKDIKYVYILRKTDDPEVFEFVVDADSNYNLPFLQDNNHDGILDEADEAVAPGVRYYDSQENSNFLQGFEHPSYEKDFFSDQWGTFLSGYAPIFFQDEAVAALEVDMEITDAIRLLQNRFTPWFWFLSILGSLLVVYFLLQYFLSKH